LPLRALKPKARQVLLQISAANAIFPLDYLKAKRTSFRQFAVVRLLQQIRAARTANHRP
jgi:hypothetical protein